MDHSRRHWDDLEAASAYDDEFRGIIGEYLKRTEVDAALAEIRFSPGAMILDAGCGSGRHIESMPLGISCIGADTSVNMLKIAKSKLGDRAAMLVAADATQLPFRDKSFDGVISIRVLQHIQAQRDAIREFARVSKPGAVICVLSYNSWTVHCLIKCLRHGRLAALTTRMFRKLLGPHSRSRLTRIHREYRNDFNSLPELSGIFQGAGLRVITRKGSNVSGTWILTNFWLAGLVERTLPRPLRSYLYWCDRIEQRWASKAPFNLFMDKVIVVGVRP
jgi:ubiquinone/menaquinone biosynthesis C-methylase UbiE